MTATPDGAIGFTEDRTVRVSVSGSGASGVVDFAAVPAFDIEIAAGAASGAGTFTLRPADDAVDEDDEAVTVSGASGGLPVSPATIALIDDDAAPTVSIDSPSVSEGDSGSTDLTFTVTLSAASGRQVTVDWAEGTGGTATSGTDYTAITGGTLTFAAGTTSQTLDVSVTGDTTDEADETVVVTLSNAANAAIGTATGTGTITDNDEAPSLSINSPSVTEGDSDSANLTFTVILSAASSQRVTVAYADAGTGTATSGTDYTAIAGGTLTFAAGTTSQTFDVSVTGDTTDEADETVAVTLSNAANAAIGTATGTGTITDNDDAPTVTLSVADDSISENGGSTTVSAALSHASSEATTITISPLANAYAVGSDATIAIAAGETANPSDTATINAVDNDIGEADRSVTVTGSASNARGIGQVTGASLTLEDDDGGAGPSEPRDSEPTVSIDSPSVTEGDSGSANLTFTATLNKASTEQVTVDWAEGAGGTATSGTDYTAITGGTLTFAAGTTSQTFDVSVTGDTTDEADETVVVTLSNAANATISTATGTGTITDNDEAPSLSINSPSVTEGDSSSTNLTFTATLSAASGRQVTVDWAEGTGGTATSGTDYMEITGGTLTFAAGTTSQTFDVSVTGDTTDEADETVAVTLSNAANAMIGTATGTGTITDDDDAPTVTLSVADDSISENGGSTTVSATLSHASSEATTITISPLANAYTVGSDATIAIAAGETANSSDTATISAVDNDIEEADRSVIVTGSASNARGIGQVTGASLTLEDDDGASEPQDSVPTVSISSPSVSEGNSGSTIMRFTVTLSAASSQQVTVDWAEGTGGTATSGTDYTAITGGTLTIAAGTTSQTFDVSVIGDTTDEADETIVVTLSNATNATIATATGTGTIRDNDAPTLSIDSPSVTEGDSGSKNLTFTVMNRFTTSGTEAGQPRRRQGTRWGNGSRWRSVGADSCRRTRA